MKQPGNKTGKMTAKEDCGMRLVSRALTVAARRPMTVANHNAASLSSSSLPHSTKVVASPSGGATPVWFAALMAAGCRARSLELQHEIHWQAVAGRAEYTNFGGHLETIEPLGVNLEAGDTLAIHWPAGETGYTIEVYSDEEQCA